MHLRGTGSKPIILQRSLSASRCVLAPAGSPINLTMLEGPPFLLSIYGGGLQRIRASTMIAGPIYLHVIRPQKSKRTKVKLWGSLFIKYFFDTIYAGLFPSARSHSTKLEQLPTVFRLRWEQTVLPQIFVHMSKRIAGIRVHCVRSWKSCHRLLFLTKHVTRIFCEKRKVLMQVSYIFAFARPFVVSSDCNDDDASFW